jgi:hypothetical protein
MVFLIAGVVGLLFGGADQYLGSLVLLGPWASSVSVMSAPWLALPFAFGSTQRQPRRAILLGLTAVASALIGYFAMTLSPMEGVAISAFPTYLIHLIPSQWPWIVGGAVTAPLFALLGQRWRLSRSWMAAVLVAASFAGEPLARLAVGRLYPPDIVWVSEIVLGVVVAGGFLAAGLAHSQRRRITA